jgi:hypothetical protein
VTADVPETAPRPAVRGRLARVLLTVAVAGVLAGGRPPSAGATDDEIVVDAPSAAALAPPTVTFELRDRGGRPLAADRESAADADTDRDLAAGLSALLGGAGGLGALGAGAVLDTGASASVVSAATVAARGVALEAGARYVEVGMTGEHAMGVSRPVTLALDGAATASKRKGGGPEYVFRDQRLLVNEGAGDLASLLASPGASVDVIGMPAIADLVVELAPGGGIGGPRVVLHARGARVAADAWVPLALVDFNRLTHPKNRGPRPTLGENPVVEGVRAVLDDAEASGDWLLDTGSVVTVLSSASARALGLVGAGGKPIRRPDISLPVGGIGGSHRDLPGWRIDRIELDTEDDRVVVLDGPTVLVHDVATTRDDGTRVVLDGILGMNVLLGGPGDAPFRRVVIDVDRERLGLTPAS